MLNLCNDEQLEEWMRTKDLNTPTSAAVAEDDDLELWTLNLRPLACDFHVNIWRHF